MTDHQKINIECVRLAFVAPFEISKLKRDHQDVLRVEISKDGFIGRGETPAISYYGMQVEEMATRLKKELDRLEKFSWEHPKEWYAEVFHVFPDHSFLRAALDAAAWDLYGQLQGKMVWELLGLPNPINAKPSNFTIGIGTPAAVVDQIKKYPWQVYKLKLGSDQDREVLKAVAQETDSRLRLDANGAWTVEETRSFLEFCTNELPPGFVELIEEPNLPELQAAFSDLKKESPIPFYADESFQSEDDLAVIGQSFHGINVKLDKCGGITPALKIIEKAKALGLSIQLGCMSASGISLAPAIQLSALADVVDLDAAMLIVDADFGVYYEHGIAMMRGKKGMGIVLD